MSDKKKCTVKDFQRYKEEGQKWTWTICYDYTFAGIVDESKTEMILVGDSLGNVITGDGSTIPVTLDIIIHHIRSVVKGAPNTFVVGDMPFGTYNVSNEQAVMTANRIMQEGGSDCVKLEGGAKMAPRIRAIVDAGIPVMAHIGLTPQSISQLGGFKVQGKDSSVADQLLADALAVEAAGAFAIVIKSQKDATNTVLRDTQSSTTPARPESSVSVTEESTDDSLSAAELLADITVGYNIGNSLDSCPTTGRNDGTYDTAYFETCWGNPVITKEYVNAISAAGFNAIRLPVTWYYNTYTENGSLKIREDWMNRVTQVVDYALAN